MPTPRRHHTTALEIPADHGIRPPRSTPTQVGHASLTEPLAIDRPPHTRPLSRPAPWTEHLYVSPSGRIFLPPGYDFEHERPRALTPRAMRREPPAPRPSPRRAHVVLGLIATPALPAESEPPSARPRVITRESWLVPGHLRS